MSNAVDHPRIVERLLAHGVDPAVRSLSPTSPSRLTPLDRALRKSNMETVKLLLAQPKVLVSFPECGSMLWVSAASCPEALPLLAAAGLDLSLVPAYYALAAATRRQQPQAIEFFLAALPFIKPDEENDLEFAQYKTLGVALIGNSASPQMAALLWKSFPKDSEVLPRLDEKGSSLLHLAAQSQCDPQIIQDLIDHGLSPTQANLEGKTPKDLATPEASAVFAAHQAKCLGEQTPLASGPPRPRF